MITQELQDAISIVYIGIKNKQISNKDLGVYLVMFRLLNKDSNVLVYNYIFYPRLFYTCFISFLLYIDRYLNNTGYREGGDFFSILDLNLNRYKEEEQIDTFFVLNKRFERHFTYLGDPSYNNATNITEAFQLMNRLAYVCGNEKCIFY